MPHVCGTHARVAELADALDLGSSVFGREGSSPFLRTLYRERAGAIFRSCPSRRWLGPDPAVSSKLPSQASFSTACVLASTATTSTHPRAGQITSRSTMPPDPYTQSVVLKMIPRTSVMPPSAVPIFRMTPSN